MKLLLTSEGLCTPKIVEALVRLCGKPQQEISFAVINEAYAVELGHKDWVLNDLTRIFSNFPASVDMVNLLALSPEQIRERCMQQDVLMVLGGHTDYLMSVFNRSGFSKLLPELLATKVYVGSSAGSMVLGRRISSAAYREVYNEGDTYGIERYMDLVPFAIKPHLNSPCFPKNRPEILAKAVLPEDGLVYALADDNAVVAEGQQVSFVNGQPWRVGA